MKVRPMPYFLILGFGKAFLIGNEREGDPRD